MTILFSSSLQSSPKTASATLRAIGWFAGTQLLLACILGFEFLCSYPAGTSVLVWGFGLVALVSHMGLMTLIWSMPLALLALTKWSRRWLPILLPVAATIFLLLLWIDRSLYGLMRLHINSLVINVLVTPGGWETLGIETQDLLLYAAAAIGVATAQWGLWIYLCRRADRSGNNAWHPWRLVLGLALVLGLTERAVYAVADLKGDQQVTQIATMLPLYQPMTVKRFMSERFGWQMPETVRLDVSDRGSLLKYPRTPLIIEARERPLNIIWIAIDSWRFDMVRPDVMPYLYERSQRGQVFTQHLSGGNSTRFGIFSLFYGIYGSYWEAILGQRQPALLFEMLAAQQYEVSVRSSAALTFPEFRQTAFVKLGPMTTDNYSGERSDQRDKQQIEDVLKLLRRRQLSEPSKPFFKFMFLDGPHGPYNYPPEFERFLPIKRSSLYSTLADESRQILLFNDYRNAVGYTDHLLQQLFLGLESLGLSEHTIVLLTGDHGEEFWENGHYGHAGAYTEYQSAVPLILFWPGRAAARYTHPTSHHDIVPTFAEYLGVKNEVKDYALGQNLFRQETRPYRVICNWEHCSLFDGQYHLIFGTRSLNAHYAEFRTADYRLTSRQDVMQGERPRHLMELMSDMSRFLSR